MVIGRVFRLEETNLGELSQDCQRKPGFNVSSLHGNPPEPPSLTWTSDRVRNRSLRAAASRLVKFGGGKILVWSCHVGGRSLNQMNESFDNVAERNIFIIP